jgi:hypothetical protein
MGGRLHPLRITHMDKWIIARRAATRICPCVIC